MRNQIKEGDKHARTTCTPSARRGEAHRRRREAGARVWVGDATSWAL